jgi:putative ABC transport system permease protein
MESIAQDFRYGLRLLKKSPGFSAVAVLTLAIGIGANCAIFTIVNAIFFAPMPLRDPSRLLSIFTADERNRGPQNAFLPVSYPNAVDIRQRAQSFSGVTIFTFAPVSMTVNGEAQQFTANLVTGNFFDVLGANLALGRNFLPQEDAEPGAGPVIILDNGFWRRNFAADRSVIGRSVLLNGQGFTIVGVAERGFQGPNVLGGPDMWIPMSMHDQILSGFMKENFNERRFLGFFVNGRLKPGVTPAQARAELATIGSQLEHDYPVPNRGRSFTSMPLLEATINPNLRGFFVRAGALMMTVVGLVLLIACANIANLLLSRAASRKREVAIRVALGATRSRIVTQLLTEAIVLSALGGALGLGLGVVGRNLLWQFRPPFFQNANLDLGLDSRVLLFTIVASLLTGIAFGLVPALQASRPDLVVELKDRVAPSSSGRRFGVRGAFVVVQFALSLVALVGAGLFILSLWNAQRIDPGFDTTHLGMLSFDLGAMSYDATRAREFERRALEIVQHQPGVRAATMSTNIPLFGGGFSRSVFPEGEDQAPGRNGVLVQIDAVAPDYFRTMGVPIMRGDGFSESLREDGAKVAIINETAARRFWPGQDAVGKRFKFFGEMDFVQVIGVARDAKYNTLGEDPTPYMYVPLIQNPSPAVTVFFRSTGPTSTVLSSVRSSVQALDRNLPLVNVWPIGEVISQALWAARFGASLLSIFALVAVVLAALGVYGVMAYAVAQRVREIGIRMALGAKRSDVLGMILGESAMILGIGMAIGLVAAFALGRLVTTLLFGVSASEPLPFIVVSLLLATVGFAASYIPARRATRIDPMVALRYE